MCSHSGQLLIAVCTRDRPTFLNVCLASLGSLEAVQDWSIALVVVDNSEGDDVRQSNQDIVRRLKFQGPVAYVHEPELGISSARNRALTIADQDGAAAVVFLDDDQAVPREWLRALIASWQEAATDVMKSAVVLETVESVSDLDTKSVARISHPHLGDTIRTNLKTCATNGVLISRFENNFFLFPFFINFISTIFLKMRSDQNL